MVRMTSWTWSFGVLPFVDDDHGSPPGRLLKRARFFAALAYSGAHCGVSGVRLTRPCVRRPCICTFLSSLYENEGIFGLPNQLVD